VVWEKLLPAIGENVPPKDEAAELRLAHTLKNLKLTPPQGAAASSMAGNVSGRTYTFEPNPARLRCLRFDFAKDACTITYHLLGGGKRRGLHHLTIGYGTWQEGVEYLSEFAPQRSVASGVWTTEDTFELTICLVEAPFILSIACRFTGDSLLVDSRVNVSFGPLQSPQFVGIAE
jgi:hypothetical protein